MHKGTLRMRIGGALVGFGVSMFIKGGKARVGEMLHRK